MFNTILDLIKNETVVAIVTTDITFNDCVVLAIDDLFIKFRNPSNGYDYIYPLEAIVQIRHLSV